MITLEGISQGGSEVQFREVRDPLLEGHPSLPSCSVP